MGEFRENLATRQFLKVFLKTTGKYKVEMGGNAMIRVLEAELAELDKKLAQLPVIQEKRRKLWRLCFDLRRLLGIPGLPGSGR
jgi:asparagine synthetase B (glutamine-hydrolysing)